MSDDTLNAEGLRIEHDAQRVTVTARALFLTRDLGAQDCTEEVYDWDVGWRRADWRHDTLVGGLGLGGAELSALARAGARVLDVGAGLGAFATEAAALGVSVDCVDLELGAGHPVFDRVRPRVRQIYPAQMDRLRQLAASGDARYAMTEPESQLFAALYDRRGAIAAAYPETDGQRLRDDARTLGRIDDQRYDLVVSAWLTVHLDDDDERRAIEAAARVTRPGGALRIKAGYGDDSVARARRWFGAGDGLVIAGRQATLEPPSARDLLVLSLR